MDALARALLARRMLSGSALDWQQPSLRQRWEDLRTRVPAMTPRDAARLLGVSEAEITAADCGDTVTRLDADWSTLLGRVGELGLVRGVTRTTHAVVETRGVYGRVDADGALRGEGIDLRVFLARWRYGYARRTSTPGGLRRSLAFFDADGTHVHEVLVERRGGVDAFERLVADHAHPEQLPWLDVARRAAPSDATTLDRDVDLHAMRASWDAMQETRDFQTLLRRFGVRRPQALRLAGAARAGRVALWSLRLVLERAASDAIPVVVLAANPGTVHIHRGPVRTARALGPWVNVLDDDFNLHVRADAIAEAWVVRKPTRDGVVTSLELFDAAGETIALLFGGPSASDRAAFAAVLDGLPVS
jgi:putative hemin transport protein